MEICIPVGVYQKVIRARKVEANERFTVIALLVLAARREKRIERETNSILSRLSRESIVRGSIDH